jgi:hypothetical protein
MLRAMVDAGILTGKQRMAFYEIVLSRMLYNPDEGS